MVLLVFALVALAAPPLIAFNVPPSSTFLNQAAALIGWGLFAAALAARSTGSGSRNGRGIAALTLALLLILLEALAASAWTGLPISLGFSGVAMAAAAIIVSRIVCTLGIDEASQTTFLPFCIGLVLAGCLSGMVGLVQVFAPSWADGNFIARTYIDGRAVGNLRQPNHLSSLLLWSIVASTWLGEARAIGRRLAQGLVLLFIFVVVLTASRTGALSMLLLFAWGLVDKRLARQTRGLLMLAPVLYAVFWYGTGLWADYSHHVFGGETRFTTQGDISSSRWGIWSNTLSLIRMHPWAGVGFGEFNFAWTLTPFPGRPVAFFDHTHNLVLQFLVELGIPLGLLVTGLLSYALWQAFVAARRPVPADAAPGEAVLRASAFMMVLLIMLHSLLEYPLWYAYFLLPTAFAFGLCLAPANAEPVPAPAAPRRLRPLVVASLVLMLGGALSLFDYARVVVIFAPSADDTRTLAERIVSGRKSIFFAHHADYAAATSAHHPVDVMPAFLSAPHYLLDARLMEAWAKALDEGGDTEHARYVAQRLREFKNEQSAAFFAPCEAASAPVESLPFQCSSPTRTFGFEDFR